MNAHCYFQSPRLRKLALTIPANVVPGKLNVRESAVMTYPK